MRGVKPAIGRSRGAVEIGLSWTHDLRNCGPARLRFGGRVLQGREIGVEVRPAGRIRHHHGHRRSRHELAWVRQELDEILGGPGEPRALQRRREVEARQRSRFPSGDAGKRRADAVHAGLVGMTGRALRLVDFLAGADVFSRRRSRAGTCDRNQARDEGETRNLHDTRSQRRASQRLARRFFRVPRLTKFRKELKCRLALRSIARSYGTPQLSSHADRASP